MFWKRDQKATEAQLAKSLTPQENLNLARQAFTKKDYKQAMAQVVQALEPDPMHPEARALFERLIAVTPDPLKLLPLSKPETPYPIRAARAYIHAKRGELAMAVTALTQIYQATPALPFFPWLVEWFAAPERVNTIDPQVMTPLAAALLGKLKEGDGDTTGEQLSQLLPIFYHYHIAHPRHAPFTSLLSILMRELGNVAEAIVMTQAAYAAQPDAVVAIALAGAYREQGDLLAAIELFRDAVQYDPAQIKTCLDVGDILCDLGRFAEAVIEYRTMLAHEPKHDWALPSSLYCEYKITADHQWVMQLKQYADKNPNHARAQKLLADAAPYEWSLPEWGDATTNFLKHSAQQHTELISIEMGGTSLESPSSRLAIELYQIERYGKANLAIGVAEIQKPDPRLPNGKVDFVLWKYTGTDPKPAIPPPPQPIAERVATLAARPYALADWLQHASLLAQQLGTPGIVGLLGTMVHPPPRPAQLPIWAWIQRVQFAATFILAYIDSGWANSARKRVLFSLARGPLDWTVEAAIVALAQLAHEEDAAAADVAQLYIDLFSALPAPGGVPYLRALSTCAAQLPVVSDDLRRRLQAAISPI